MTQPLELPEVDLDSARALWGSYREQRADVPAELPVVDFFGDSVALADELIDLVLAGTKRATAGLVIDYEAASEELPRAGDHWIACDGSGRARAVIRATEVSVGTVEGVDEAFAWDEGEGDRSRDGWLRAHRAFFARRCAALGLTYHDDLAVTFERFDVVAQA